MTNSKCDLTTSNYSYCPSYAAAVLLAVLFSLTTAGHVYQAIRLRKVFCSVLIMGGLWEVIGYAIRTVSIQHQTTTGLYTAQMLLILLAPLWINAYTYMLVGRIIHFFLDDDRIWRVKARKLTLIFVVFDIIAFAVQGTGGSMSSSDTPSTALNGLHVYTVGVALQIIFNIFFIAVTVQFQRMATVILKGSDQGGQGSHRDCLYLLRVVYVVMGLILFRNFYRLVEFAMGLDNAIIRHEWFAYVFDALPVISALVVMNVCHPGRKMQGPRSDFSEENKTRKLAKKARKVAEKGGTALSTEMYAKVPTVATRDDVSQLSQV